MNCRELTNDVLLDFADGLLPPDDAGTVEVHLRGCKGCHRRFAEIRQITAVLQRREAPAFNEELLADRDRTMMADIRTIAAETAQNRRLSEERREGLRRRVIVFRALGASAAAALLLIAIGVLTPSARKPIATSTPSHPAPTVKTPIKPDVAIAPILPVPVPPRPLLPLAGDVNGDGIVDIADSLMISRAVAEDRTLEIANADADSDGEVSIADALWISRMVASGRLPGGTPP